MSILMPAWLACCGHRHTHDGLEAKVKVVSVHSICVCIPRSKKKSTRETETRKKETNPEHQTILDAETEEKFKKKRSSQNKIK